MTREVSLQINLAPSDAPYVGKVLPHQLRAWGGQVSEIVLALDLHRSRGAQFGSRSEQQLDEIRTILARACDRHPHARVAEVDYGGRARADVAERFFGGRPVPLKDFRGGPYYSYFHGLASCAGDVVLHCDADMMFGGLSQTWLSEAIGYLERPEVLFVNPFPGPPAGDGELVESARYAPVTLAPGVLSFNYVSTRVFLVDLRRLAERICPLVPERMPGLRMRLGALRARRTTHDLPENVLTRAMARAGMQRIDVLGTPPGMWAIHPVVRDARYYEHLSSLVRRVERGAVTPEQLGRYNLHESMLVRD
jgi:hypothetical protein